ncbi:MAG: transcriptional regulator [Nostoc sp. ChiSLP01]|nr:addiction module antidote protein, HigA family [Nostoc sp. CmiSLP01]MDZ8283971.1 addiction module antidote protein, HigA family [Nostoc sp. ChiSLP01]
MTTTAIPAPTKESPLLFEGLTWREFKAVEQLLDRPGYRLSFLDGVLEIRRMPGEPHETVKKRIAARLSRYFGNSAQFWLNLQTQYDIRQALEENAEVYNQISKLPFNDVA